MSSPLEPQKASAQHQGVSLLKNLDVSECLTIVWASEGRFLLCETECSASTSPSITS
jgi:hypothetical protein